MQNLKISFIFLLTLVFVGCDSDNDPELQLNVPETYEFTRNGESTVDFSGQTSRLDMLAEMKDYLRQGDAGEAIEVQTLLDMYANENDPFSTSDLNTSGKRLEDKTLLSDMEFFKELFESAGQTSADYVLNETVASEGQSGRIQRGTSTNYILVNEKGWEFTQFAEKGLMGSVFLYQIANVYLTDARVGSEADNGTLVEGQNYTAKEHYWDEAFGYWGVQTDFDAEGVNRFWGNYTLGREGYLGSASILQEAFLTGRAAIAINDQETIYAQKTIILQEFEKVAAATAIHYLNEAITDLSSNDQGNLFHHLSEGFGFVMALRMLPEKRMTTEQIDEVLNVHFGTDGDFWTVSATSLQEGKEAILSVFTEFESIKDEL